MIQPGSAPNFTLEESDESFGHCDCCGQVTRCIWGLLDSGEATVAAYWLRWTVDRPEHGYSIELCLGRWGDDTTPADRALVFLLGRHETNGRDSIMVVDPKELTDTKKALADRALRRDEVIGTPLAPQVFALVDAIFLQDSRIKPPEDDD